MKLRTTYTVMTELEYWRYFWNIPATVPDAEVKAYGRECMKRVLDEVEKDLH